MWKREREKERTRGTRGREERKGRKRAGRWGTYIYIMHRGNRQKVRERKEKDGLR